MSSAITRNGKDGHRPSWNFTRSSVFPGYESAQLEMLESIRNTLEGIEHSQMLQCDVASAIKEQTKLLRAIRRELADARKAKK